MIFGIGTDIIEIERIKKAVEKHRFFNEVFTDKEREYFISKGEKIEVLAGFFAAKEAVAKSMGTGFRGFSLKDVEVNHDDMGKPYINLSPKSQLIAREKNILRFHLSIAHNNSFAIAYVVAEN